MERWKPIKGHEERYEVSDHGRVRSKDMVVNAIGRGTYIRKGKILKEGTAKGGYKIVELSDGTRRHRGGKRHHKYVHVAVAEAFVDGYFEGATVDHCDFDPSNNHYSNLEWVTQKENNDRKIRAGRDNSPKGSRQAGAKLTESDIPVIRQMKKQGATLKEIGLKYSIATSTAGRIINGKLWKHV